MKFVDANTKNINAVSRMIFWAYGMHFSVKGIVLPLIIRDYSLTYTQTSLALTASSLGFLLAVLFCGKGAQRVGQKSLVTFATFCLTGASLGIALMPSSTMLISGFFLSGLCYGIIECTGTALIKRFNPEHMDRVLSQIYGFSCFSACAMALLAALVISLGLKWQVCYLLIAVILLYAGCRAFILRDNGAEGMPEIRFSQLRGLFRNTPFLLGCIAMAMYSGTETTTFSWISTYVTASGGMTMLQSSTMLAVFYLAMYLGRVLYVRVFLRAAVRRTALLMCLATAVILLLISLSLPLPLVWVVTVLCGFSMSILYPVLVSIVSGMAAENIVYSATFTAISLGNTSVNAILGVIADAHGIQWTFRFNSLLIFLAAIILGLCTRLERKSALPGTYADS